MFAFAWPLVSAIFGSAIGRMALIGAALFLVGWVKGYSMGTAHSEQATVAELKLIIAEKDRIIQTHDDLVTASEAEAEKLKSEIEAMIHVSKDDPNACVLSAPQLAQLQRLARGD